MRKSHLWTLAMALAASLGDPAAPSGDDVTDALDERMTIQESKSRPNPLENMEGPMDESSPKEESDP